MPDVRRERMYFWALLALLAALFLVLPSALLPVFASPDETAAAVTAREIAQHGRAYLAEPLATAYPWLHPRSWLSVGGRIAPVGFLAWPLVLALFERFFGLVSLPFAGALLILSSAWPFYRLMRRFGFAAAWWGTLVAFTFPSVILYANRSLFSTAAFFALALWSLWYVDWLKAAKPSARWYGFGAVLVTLTIAVRPSELVWFLPWLVWFVWGLRPDRRAWQAVSVGTIVVILPLLWLAHGAYGSWFGVGYFLHDNPTTVVTSVAASAVPPVSTGLRFLPYGLHPHLMWWNFRTYVVGFLWPWMLPLVLAVALFVVRLRSFRWRAKDVPWYASAWTFLALLAFYGSGIYADNILGVPSIGNSFLRYLMPLGALTGFAVAWLWSQFRHQTAGSFLPLAVLALSVFGAYRVLTDSQDGLIFTRSELQRYARIRTAAHAWFDPSAVIVSDRSDKVFFPDFRAVSPTPDRAELARLAQSGVALGLFSRPLSQSEKDAWRNVGLDAQELGFFGREMLYRLAKLSP